MKESIIQDLEIVRLAIASGDYRDARQMLLEMCFELEILELNP